MADSFKAVFLSYASEDLQAARRICDTLRAAGIEVWFDQSALRGGDAWDASIRRQIRSCALFIPVISANAHAREEGYFRLEWKLAVDRSHLMAGTRAFLLPVVIDDTPQEDERIPERFRELQWSRLPDGKAPAGFVQRVQQLLASFEPDAAATPRPTAGAARLEVDGRAPAPPARVAGARPVDTQTAAMPAASARRTVAWVVGLLCAILAAGILAITRLLPMRSAAPVAPAPAAAAKFGTAGTAAPAMTASDKSIAVLPFVDMSEKHDQEYFSDGLAEELIDRLAHNSELKVIARTSSFAFKGKNEDMRAIAAKLGVAHLLEGSVRKAGAEMRITAQLIRASDGVHLWSETYDRKLTDVFKVQDEIAGTVASALQATLQGSTGSGGDKTENMEAHNLYLQGRYFARRATVDDMDSAVKYLQQALQRDPNYAMAWAELAQAYVWIAQFGNQPVDVFTEKGRAAAKTALRLDPRQAEAHAALARILNAYDFDWQGAQAEVDQALALEPRNPIALGIAASIAMAMGDFDKALRLYQEEIRVDPLDSQGYLLLGLSLNAAHRLDEAMAALQAGARIAPGQIKLHFALAQVALAQGRPDEAYAYNKDEQAPWYRLTGEAIIEDARGNRAAADAALAEMIRTYSTTAAAQIAEIYAQRGDRDNAYKWIERGIAERDSGVRWLKFDPLYAPLRGDPRYPLMLKKLGLPPG
jgi:TolB-like protein/cytochrome c-type biogenesis protein CcmH/NrfG